MGLIIAPPQTGHYLISEASGTRSRDIGLVNATAGPIPAGTVMGIIAAANTATATAFGDNVGNGTLGSLTAVSPAITGTYKVVIEAEAEDAGTFSVTDPLGRHVGTGTVGEDFAEAGLAFKITAGATDFDVDDGFSIAVVEGKGEWGAYDGDANNGLQTAQGILYHGVDASSKDVLAVFHVRDCEVEAAALIGLDDTAAAALAANGIILR